MSGVIATSYLRSGVVPEITTVNYTPSSALIANPERGFYQHEETHSDDYEALDVTDLTNYRTGSEKITQILRIFYLDDFISSDISPDYLAKIDDDFDTVRAAGIKAIVRFAYSDDDTGDYEPTKTRILSHIDQLAPVLEAHKDVIVALQAGFIGKYGEWYYSTHFGNQGTVSAGQYADRKEVVDYMLAQFPTEIPIQVRTPDIKYRITGSTAAVTEGQAYGSSDKARLGHHNDAFLSDEENEGTYINVPLDRAFIAAESRFVPVGGETNTAQTPYTTCAVSQSELAELGFSYLNIDYEPNVIAQWNTEGCLSDIRKKLGYRFKLTEATLPNSASDTLPISITIANDGYATPFKARGTYIILRGTTDEYPLQLTTDCRLWGAIENLDETLDIASVPPGEYAMFLYLPDALRSEPSYAIQFANTGTWEPATGYNSLNHTITIG